ncbi:MAG: glycosyltransferase [Candidatus Moranbacteria bacterium]|nr:glycosyltransferase [Candidatus Moranbacteria bacterium]
MNDQKQEKRAENRQKVAIVHDFLVDFGGAERVLADICSIYPDAPIFTLIHDEGKMRGKFEGKEIKTSFLQKFPKFLRNRKRFLLPFLMVAPETFDLREYDLVISSSSAWSKGIVTRLNTTHIAYIHSPMRFVWDYNERYLKEIGSRAGIFKRLVLNYVRIWDNQAAQRPDKLIANSAYTQRRIQKYYKRDSEVVYPGVKMIDENELQESSSNSQISNLKSQNYFLVVSRLSAYKKVDLVVEAFNKLGLPLVVIGEGEQERHLRKSAAPNVKILGWKSDEEVEKYYAGARAFIFPAVDDFGLTIVESMSHGIPVIAIKKGGAMEIVKEGVNGEFFEAQTVEVISDGVRRFLENEEKYDKSEIKKSVEKFSKENFKIRIAG